MNSTAIEWCDFTWNPVTGCPGPKVSPGCAHCYAERTALTRMRGRFGFDADNPFGIHVFEERLLQPYKMKKGKRIFVCSMGDIFHQWVPADMLAKIFAVMALCPQHTFMLLTKRPERMRDFITDTSTLANDRRGLAYVEMAGRAGADANMDGLPWPLPNVWLGVTVCNQKEADRLIPVLMEIPAAKRFLSLEPLLGLVRLTRWAEEFTPFHGLTDWADFAWPEWVPEVTRNELMRFWDKDHRGAAGYNSQYQGRWVAAPAFGAAMGMPDEPIPFVCHPSHPKAAIRGKFIPAWSNMGRLVLPSGEVRCCAFSHGPNYLALWPQIGKSYDDPHMRRIDWIICGGETGPGARPMHPDWVRSLRDECQLSPVPGVHVPPPVPFFFKGWGEWYPAEYEAAEDMSFEAEGLVLPDGRFVDYSKASDDDEFWDESGVRYLVKLRPYKSEYRNKIKRNLDGRWWNEVPA